MPIYEYKCNSCGKQFEYMQPITDEALTKCPPEICQAECKGDGDVTRLISKNISFVFNGSGFYLTDYVHKNGNPAHSTANEKSNGNNGSSAKESTSDGSAVKDKTTT